jgi:peroxiredoxin
VVMGNPKIVGDYGFITAIPTTFVIDRRGDVVTAYEGLSLHMKALRIKPLSNP